MGNNKKISIMKNGPYLVSGKIPLSKVFAVVGESGFPEEWKEGEKYPDKETYSLCRCGESKNKPYCDGTHEKIYFDVTETASSTTYLEVAKKYVGPELVLTDAEELCSIARFCDIAGGTWRNVLRSNRPESKKIAIQTACNCPSGRLVVYDKENGKPIEPDFEPSIQLIEDPQEGVSGPIWVKGKVEIFSSEEIKYEVRNRVTLCRCGNSQNKPFCDGLHIYTKFSDGDKSLK
jgi:CDGSH-type Zn-finger protein